MFTALLAPARDWKDVLDSDRRDDFWGKLVHCLPSLMALGSPAQVLIAGDQSDMWNTKAASGSLLHTHLVTGSRAKEHNFLQQSGIHLHMEKLHWVWQMRLRAESSCWRAEGMSEKTSALLQGGDEGGHQLWHLGCLQQGSRSKADIRCPDCPCNWWGDANTSTSTREKARIFLPMIPWCFIFTQWKALPILFTWTSVLDSKRISFALFPLHLWTSPLFFVFPYKFSLSSCRRKHIATQGLVIQHHPALTPASRFPSSLISWLYANVSLQCIKMNKSTSLRNCLERCYLKYEMPGSLEFHCLFQNTYFHVKQLQNIFWALTEEAPVWEEFLTISCALWCGPVGSAEAGRWSCQVKTVHWPLPPCATCKGYQEDKPQLVIQLILWLT